MIIVKPSEKNMNSTAEKQPLLQTDDAESGFLPKFKISGNIHPTRLPVGVYDEIVSTYGSPLSIIEDDGREFLISSETALVTRIFQCNSNGQTALFFLTQNALTDYWIDTQQYRQTTQDGEVKNKTPFAAAVPDYRSASPDVSVPIEEEKTHEDTSRHNTALPLNEFVSSIISSVLQAVVKDPADRKGIQTKIEETIQNVANQVSNHVNSLDPQIDAVAKQIKVAVDSAVEKLRQQNVSVTVNETQFQLSDLLDRLNLGESHQSLNTNTFQSRIRSFPDQGDWYGPHRPFAHGHAHGPYGYPGHMFRPSSPPHMGGPNFAHHRPPPGRPSHFRGPPPPPPPPRSRGPPNGPFGFGRPHEPFANNWSAPHHRPGWKWPGEEHSRFGPGRREFGPEPFTSPPERREHWHRYGHRSHRKGFNRENVDESPAANLNVEPEPEVGMDFEDIAGEFPGESEIKEPSDQQEKPTPDEPSVHGRREYHQERREKHKHHHAHSRNRSRERFRGRSGRHHGPYDFGYGNDYGHNFDFSNDYGHGGPEYSYSRGFGPHSWHGYGPGRSYEPGHEFHRGSAGFGHPPGYGRPFWGVSESSSEDDIYEPRNSDKQDNADKSV